MIADVQKKFKPLPGDIILLGGRDWEYLPKDIEEKNPAINVIQHVRHADPQDPRYPFLSRKAHRICVSPEVAQSIQDTGKVNGPVDVLNIGLDPADIPNIEHKTADVFIAGLKARDLANGVRQRLEDAGLDVDCVDELIPRAQFLKRVASARIVLALPHETEGFFLPALEAMLAGCAVVCPDAVGNRGFCIDHKTCLVPDRNTDSLADAVFELHKDRKLGEQLVSQARQIAENYSIANERRNLLALVNGISPRNILLTGLPRSGTTLACNLLGSLLNTVALHEPLKPKDLQGLTEKELIKRITRFFDDQRKMILKKGKATSKSAGGKVPDNPLGGHSGDGKRIRQIDSREINVTNVGCPEFDLCVKHPSFFTGNLPRLVEHFDCYGFIRNPFSVLLSWRDTPFPVSRGHAPVAEASSPELTAKLETLDDVLDRQVALIDFFFGQYSRNLKDNLVRYEDVIATKGKALAKVTNKAADLEAPLRSRNTRNLSRDENSLRVAERLLASDNACWEFYTKQDVQALIAGDGD